MTQARVILGEGPSTEKISPDLPVVRFMTDLGGFSSLWVVPPCADGPGEKQAEQAMRHEPVSSAPPWLLHQLLPPASCPDSL